MPRTWFLAKKSWPYCRQVFGKVVVGVHREHGRCDHHPAEDDEATSETIPGGVSPDPGSRFRLYTNTLECISDKNPGQSATHLRTDAYDFNHSQYM